jgi:hypothetical protein
MSSGSPVELQAAARLLIDAVMRIAVSKNSAPETTKEPIKQIKMAERVGFEPY